MKTQFPQFAFARPQNYQNLPQTAKVSFKKIDFGSLGTVFTARC